MHITNNFSIPSPHQSEPSQGCVAKVNKDAQQQSNNEGKQQNNHIVVAPDAQGTDNAQAYQRFVREDSAGYSQQAIASYTSFEKQQERESVQSMFGVDIYA